MNFQRRESQKPKAFSGSVKRRRTDQEHCFGAVSPLDGQRSNCEPICANVQMGTLLTFVTIFDAGNGGDERFTFILVESIVKVYSVRTPMLYGGIWIL